MPDSRSLLHPSTLPATYELDPSTGEAIGHTLPYCSVKCQAADIPNAPEHRSVEPTGGEDMAGMGNQCCGCGVEL